MTTPEEVAQVLKDGLTGAQALLPKLEEEQQRLLLRLREVSERIQKLRQLVQMLTAVPGTPLPTRTQGARKDTHNALSKTQGSLSIKELVTTIQEQTGRSYAQGTIYQVLHLGKHAGKYVNTQGRWSLKAQP